MASGRRRSTVLLCALAVLLGVDGRSARGGETYKTRGVRNGVKWTGEFEVQGNGQLRGTIALPENPGVGVLPAVAQLEGDRVVVRLFHRDKQIMELWGETGGESVSGR